MLDVADRVADRRGFHRRRVLAQPAERIERAAGRARAAPAQLGAAETRITCSAPAAAASSSRRDSAAGRSTGGAPRRASSVSGANRTSGGSVRPGTLSAARDDVDQVVARQTGEIERLGAARPGRARRRKQRAAERLAHQPEDEIAPRVEIVHAEQQLAEAGLAEVLGQQLRVAPAQIVRAGGVLSARAAAQQIPQPVGEVLRPRADHRAARRAAPRRAARAIAAAPARAARP